MPEEAPENFLESFRALISPGYISPALQNAYRRAIFAVTENFTEINLLLVNLQERVSLLPPHFPPPSPSSLSSLIVFPAGFSLYIDVSEINDIKSRGGGLQRACARARTCACRKLTVERLKLWIRLRSPSIVS